MQPHKRMFLDLRMVWDWYVYNTFTTSIFQIAFGHLEVQFNQFNWTLVFGHVLLSMWRSHLAFENAHETSTRPRISRASSIEVGYIGPEANWNYSNPNKVRPRGVRCKGHKVVYQPYINHPVFQKGRWFSQHSDLRAGITGLWIWDILVNGLMVCNLKFHFQPERDYFTEKTAVFKGAKY